MTNEEAIKTIMTHVEHWHRLLRDKICDETEGKETIEAFLMAIEALNQNQWIPCEERLPDVNADVLYCDVNGNKPAISMGLLTLGGEVTDVAKLETICEYSDLPHPMTFIADPTSISSEQWKGLRELVHHNRIIAWMPLPKAYEGKTK